MNEVLESKLEHLPDSPGVYQFKNNKGKTIYVGKAKNLKYRVKSYFQNAMTSLKTAVLIKKIFDLELIITDSEIEALVLENNLIKEFKPRYNINLKDDKSFPYIKVTNEIFPRIFPTRRFIRDGSKYFGPYTNVRDMKSALRMINQIFKIRSCKLNIDQNSIDKKKFKICLDYHIKKCDGPCEGLVSEVEYKSMVNQVIKLLKGKTENLIDELKLEMEENVRILNFEKAAELRDKISQLSSISEKQKIVNTDREDRDIVSLAFEGKDAACSIFVIRDGKFISKKQIKISIEEGESLEEIYAAVIKQYYDELVEIPNELVLETEPSDFEAIFDWLSLRLGKKIKITVPKREGDLKSLLKMCKENAILQLKELQTQKMKKEGNVPYTLAALQRDLRLKHLPKHIECFDISNLQGTDSVASMVVFIDGKPKRSLYRKYIIRTVTGPDDFASMREVIERRFSKLINEKSKLPDLIMIDGGKGQLSSAIEILEKLELKDYTAIGLAKKLEEIYLKDEKDSVLLPKTSSSLKLLQQIRDEAHRFAVTFHKLRREKRTITTELLDVPGIGNSLAKKLLSEIGSLSQVQSTDIGTLTKIIGKKRAIKLIEYFNAKKE